MTRIYYMPSCTRFVYQIAFLMAHINAVTALIRYQGDVLLNITRVNKPLLL